MAGSPTEKTDGTRYKVLVVENDPTDVLLLKEWLEEADGEYDLTQAERLENALTLAHTRSFDVVLLDLGLPDSQGLNTLVLFRAGAPSLPVVVLTGLTDLQAGLEALKLGAQDYMVKQDVQPAPLARSVRYAVERMRFKQELQRKNLELEEANQALQREVTKRQAAQLETVRIHQDRVNIKGEFLSHVSHELRSPLTAVHQFTTILLDGLDGPLTKDQREHLEIMFRNVNHLKLMIDDLLDASRAEASKLTVRRSCVSVEQIIKQCVQSQEAAARDKGLHLGFEAAAELPAVYADSSRVAQVLANLVDNAMKFSRPNTKITIGAAISKDDPTVICVSVADHGCGIDPEDAERIFERLYQVKNAVRSGRQGLGLGLYICKELIALHGGKIWVDSKRQSGSTFHFTLPIFTIETTVLPILSQEGRLVPSVALVTLQLAPERKWESERDRQRMLNRATQLLERCILPDMDVLLPPQHRDESDFLSVLARTDAQGAEVLLSRIKDQLSRRADFKVSSVSTILGSEVIDFDAVRTLPVEEAVAAAIVRLKETLNAKHNKGTVVR